MEENNRQELIQEISRFLIRAKLTIATAESCTGGYLSYLLTSVPGSSAFYRYGMVVYSDEAKSTLLAIPEEFIKSYGALSEEVAESMAVNIRKIMKTDIGLSITGIAGPNGGSYTKPVGTVYICLDLFGQMYHKKCNFETHERNDMRVISAYSALEFLFKQLSH